MWEESARLTMNYFAVINGSEIVSLQLRVDSERKVRREHAFADACA
jgi:hypothetical protein